ncbi:hypothetical protein [Brevibacillus centrosporus]|uniref:hypothetical protein n=1 Tax=Brevibacillus centrosporus TaxID=54910 RepID=UPI002E210FCF|nr:hypothetical protein [Brevibacillus centrosporus]
MARESSQEAEYPAAGSMAAFVERPVVAEDDFGEMCFRIYDSTQYSYPIHIKWFEKTTGIYGTVNGAWGLVREIDVEHYSVKLVNQDDSRWIRVKDIVSVTK